jgi:hypothetical protein
VFYAISRYLLLSTSLFKKKNQTNSNNKQTNKKKPKKRTTKKKKTADLKDVSNYMQSLFLCQKKILVFTSGSLHRTSSSLKQGFRLGQPFGILPKKN